MTGDNEGPGEPGPGMPQATGGGRVTWEAMPDEATVLIERLLGGGVVSATNRVARRHRPAADRRQPPADPRP
jgi:hypothetical protein